MRRWATTGQFEYMDGQCSYTKSAGSLKRHFDRFPRPVRLFVTASSQTIRASLDSSSVQRQAKELSTQSTSRNCPKPTNSLQHPGLAIQPRKHRSPAHPLPKTSDVDTNSAYFHSLFNLHCRSLTGEGVNENCTCRFILGVSDIDESGQREGPGLAADCAAQIYAS